MRNGLAVNEPVFHCDQGGFSSLKDIEDRRQERVPRQIPRTGACHRAGGRRDVRHAGAQGHGGECALRRRRSVRKRTDAAQPDS